MVVVLAVIVVEEVVVAGWVVVDVLQDAKTSDVTMRQVITSQNAPFFK